MPDDVDVTGAGGDVLVESDSDSGLPPTPDAGRTPGGEDEGEGVVDLEQVAEEFDAEALARLDGNRSRRPTKGEGGEAGDGTGVRSDIVEDFIEKNYQGDRNEFIHSLYASREEMKRLRSELDEVKRGREETARSRSAIEPRDLETAFKESRASDPELQALDHEITAIDNDVKAATNDVINITKRAQSVAGAVKEAQGRLSKAEPEERPMVRAEIAELNAEILALDSDYKLAQTEIRRLSMEKRRAQREVIRAEQSLRESMSDEEDAANERVETERTTRQQFDSSITSHFTALGFDPKSEQGQFLRETCRTKLRDYFLSQGDGFGLDGAQIHAAVGSIIAAAIKSGIRPSKQPPRRPTITPRPIVTPRPPVVTRSGSRAPSSPRSSLDGVLDDPNLSPKQKADFVRKRASAVMQAGSRVRSPS